MIEFRHFVRLQICCRKLVSLSPRHRAVNMRFFIGMLLATIHRKSPGTAIRDRILDFCPLEIITYSGINHLSYCYRRGVEDRFCIGSILCVLKRAENVAGLESIGLDRF